MAAQPIDHAISAPVLLVPARVARRAAVPSWPWRRGAMLLAGAASLISVSAMLSADPEPASWPMLLLVIGGVPLAAATAFLPARLARLTGIAAALVLLTGIPGAIGQTGWLFAPALVVTAGAVYRLWRDPA